MIELIDFSKSYSSYSAVRNFSMKCQEGRITGILGPNGAGKTTILKAVCARHFPSDGKCLINGLDTTEYSEEVRRLTGFVEEQASIPGEYTVNEYILFSAGINGIEKAVIRENLDRVKSQFELSDVWKKKIKTLSKGFKERVSFAAALVYNPPVLVFDEPAGGLDPAQIIRMRAMIKSLSKNHTILLSTHLMQEVDALCDYIYIINKGVCVASGTSSSITAENKAENLEQAFFKLVQDKTESSDIIL